MQLCEYCIRSLTGSNIPTSPSFIVFGHSLAATCPHLPLPPPPFIVFGHSLAATCPHLPLPPPSFIVFGHSLAATCPHLPLPPPPFIVFGHSLAATSPHLPLPPPPSLYSVTHWQQHAHTSLSLLPLHCIRSLTGSNMPTPPSPSSPFIVFGHSLAATCPHLPLPPPPSLYSVTHWQQHAHTSLSLLPPSLYSVTHWQQHAHTSLSLLPPS